MLKSHVRATFTLSLVQVSEISSSGFGISGFGSRVDAQPISYTKELSTGSGVYDSVLGGSVYVTISVSGHAV